MASSLITVYPDNDTTAPYETLSSSTDDGDVGSIVATGGLISNFNDP